MYTTCQPVQEVRRSWPRNQNKWFIKYSFFKTALEWRRLPQADRERSKAEFAAVVDEFSPQITVNSYSLLGTRGDVDFMLWKISPTLELLDGLASQLNRTELGKYLHTPHSYLAMTRRSPYVDRHHIDHHRAGAGGDQRGDEGHWPSIFLRVPLCEDQRLVPAARRGEAEDDDPALPGGPQVPLGEDKHQLFLRPGRPGIRPGL